MRIFENRFNTDIVKPVLEKVVLVGKTVTGIKFKVTQRNFVGVIRKSDPAGVGNAVIFALNTELMQMIILPSLHDLNDIVQSR
ncbi:hypothetical protein AA106_12370 [Photorhabdus laumondii subsp. laumondii]|uniref:Photorhabdus luminescens subsp. laumondii TTO1 complete genome segment 8/17 n=1 Tax=Photorhabdus laumondii subsp. laumondii (strain DSM 15139 / CIP 105565 / TT01) TaxID=243265 RepID=Q7N4H4_PHOLL|nr:hypothetical protein A4R40_11790 [Photorhabdus laumondii subsp. laumondii]KTL60558.1 hypothetical protein AA106_12370 [Photorhabdus laumondii subsp. laumondii]CAE14656.1 unnamed protein product [Photorhabdus laumondii subsp. laumondii TTO1]